MFIAFAGNMININYIINIYKIINVSTGIKRFSINLKYNNIQDYKNVTEYYSNEKERDKKFDELINLINK